MCYSLWYNAPPTMLPAGRPATSWVHYTTNCNTQSSAPEDGRNQHPKHVELIGIINKLLLLLLVGVYVIYFSLFMLSLSNTIIISVYSKLHCIFFNTNKQINLSQNRNKHNVNTGCSILNRFKTSVTAFHFLIRYLI